MGKADMKTEVKYAIGGFAGGFLLCFLLLGSLGSLPLHTQQFAKAKPVSPSSIAQEMTITVTNLQIGQMGIWQPPGWMLGVPSRKTVNITNMQIPVLRIWEPPRWRGFVPGQPGWGYSLDLIDDIHPEALPMPKQ
jgi:hypothetical protein